MVGCNSMGCNSIERNSLEKPTIHPNLNATMLYLIPFSYQQHFRLNKINEIKIILLQRLKKEN